MPPRLSKRTRRRYLHPSPGSPLCHQGHSRKLRDYAPSIVESVIEVVLVGRNSEISGPLRNIGQGGPCRRRDCLRIVSQSKE